MIAACSKTDPLEYEKTQEQQETQTPTTNTSVKKDTTPTNTEGWEALHNHPFGNEANHIISFSLNNKGYALTGARGSGNSTIWETRSFWEYNPDTDSWKELDNYPGPTRGFGIGDTWKGKFYFGFGASSQFKKLNDLWMYDPETKTFTELPACPCVGRAHPAFRVLNDKIFVGAGSSDGDLDDWWAFDLKSRKWEQKKSMPGIRHHPFHFKSTDRIVVGGGHDENWYAYDPEKDTWTKVDSAPGWRVAGTEFQYNGKGYALSGTDGNKEHTLFPTGEFWVYDFGQDSWEQLPPHPGTSRWSPSSFIIDGYVYLFSGTSRGHQGAMWRYPLDQQFLWNLDLFKDLLHPKV